MLAVFVTVVAARLTAAVAATLVADVFGAVVGRDRIPTGVLLLPTLLLERVTRLLRCMEGLLS